MFKQGLRIGITAVFVVVMITIGYLSIQKYTQDVQARQTMLVEKKIKETMVDRESRLSQRQLTIEREPARARRPSTKPGPDTAPPPPPIAAIQKDDKPVVVGAAEIEIFGVVKVKLDDNNSWILVFKMLVLTLGTFFGIKFINFGFRKFE